MPEDNDRLTTNAERFELKAATERSLVRAGGGNNFQYYTRVAPTQLHRYCNPDEKDFIALDIAVEMDRKARSPINIGAAARLLGYRLEPLNSGGDERSIAEMIGTSIRECSEAHSVVLEAGADGVYSRNEIRNAFKEIDEGIESLQQTKSALNDMLPGAGK